MVTFALSRSVLVLKSIVALPDQIRTKRLHLPTTKKYEHYTRDTYKRQSIIAAASPDSSSEAVGTKFGFQLNERYLEWSDSAARQLIRIYVAQKLDQTLEEVEEKLLELSVLLPDIHLNEKLDRLSANLVLQLVQDTDLLARRLLELREVLPESNVSQMVSSNTWLLSSPSAASLQTQMAALQAAMPSIDVGRLVQDEPRLLMVDINAVMAEIRRLLPASDPVQVLCNDPGMVLSMRQAGLPSSLEIDEGM